MSVATSEYAPLLSSPEEIIIFSLKCPVPSFGYHATVSSSFFELKKRGSVRRRHRGV